MRKWQISRLAGNCVHHLSKLSYMKGIYGTCRTIFVESLLASYGYTYLHAEDLYAVPGPSMFLTCQLLLCTVAQLREKRGPPQP